MNPVAMRTIIIGLGNKLFGDDGAGIAVAEKLREFINTNRAIEITTSSLGGLRIIDLLSGFDKAVIVDSIITGQHPPGYIQKWNYEEMINSTRMVSFHDVNFATAVKFAEHLNIPMPTEISVYTIEVRNVESFSESLTPKIKDAVDLCAQRILVEINEELKSKNETHTMKFENKKVIKC